ncbi:MAG TPA: maleylpyruvate isomerase family mycothiol-dependent enzyme [Actinoplanes sp.]|nr:maleylpyruvate isomerase family mycothiol-dependent enzyme [Actinoplanes sp.]
MDASLKQLHDQIDDATALLLETVGRLSDEEVRQPSLLPGWTRGHVLTHLARGGDALRSLLEGRPDCRSPDARDADIEAGAGRPAAEHAADIRASAAAFGEAALVVPDAAWRREVQVLGHKPFPLSQVLIRRLVEVELHHVDLNAAYRPSDWPTTFNELELTEPMRTRRADRIV